MSTTPAQGQSRALFPPPQCGRHRLNLRSVDILMLKTIEQCFSWAQKEKLASPSLNELREHFRKC